MRKILWFIPLTLLLAACAPVVTTIPIVSTPTETPVSPSVTPMPSSTSLPIITTPTHLAPIATEAYEQVYFDPAGWFSINLPAAWEAKSANAFSGEEGFFETGSMPEMIYRHYPTNICHWMANIASSSTYYIITPANLNLSHKARHCALATLPEITPASIQIIIENPEVSAEQRFFYIKTDAEHFDGIIDTFAWLRPVDRYREPAFQPLPLSPDDTIFWENATPLSSKFSIKEYVLPLEAQKSSPFREMFGHFIPADAPWVNPQKETNISVIDVGNEELKVYGYEFRTDPTGKNAPQLYKDGNLLLDKINYQVKRMYTLSTPEKPIVALVVSAQDGCYLIQKDLLTKWGKCFNDPRLAPIFYKGGLLWLRTVENKRIQVETSQRDTIYSSFATYESSKLPVNQFRSWRDHWILGVADYLIQDGEILNQKFGFEEVYDWQLVKDRPFYFFRKGPRVGISYDGQFLASDYNEIGHGMYNGPRGDGSKVAFFGRRGETWYYVVVEAK